MATVEEDATDVVRRTLHLMNLLRPWAQHGEVINRVCVELTLAILKLAGPTEETPDAA